jgi:hypothetical protein
VGEPRAPLGCAAAREQHARFSHLPLPREVWSAPGFEAGSAHMRGCAACQAWSLAEQLLARGVDPARYPCAHIAEQVTHRCPQHPDPRDCPDVLVLPAAGAYGLPIRDGGAAVSLIRYCPWCGTRLPEPRPAPDSPA